MNNSRILLACLLILGACHPLFAKSYEVASPDGKIKTTVTFDETTGTLTFQATSGESPIFAQSPLGILTNRARFTDGLKLLGVTEAKIDETYTLPQGKVSTYHNKANERTLSLEKGDQKLNMIFRAYDDGIAFRYAIPGTGDIEITGEATAFHVAGKPAYWGQSHPNAYGYEFPLGRIDHESYSLALLCELAESKHWVLLAQAATYSDYCIPHLTRADRNSNVLKVTFPIDQKEPIKTTLPFASPWRVAVISANDLATIVEQTMFENLNPPTEPELVNADWIQPGRSSWDWFAGDKANWKGWLDFAAEMGWEYHLVDDGWEGYVKDPVAATEYAKSKGCGIFAWRRTPGLMEAEAIEKLFKQYSEIGFRGSKVDFFDRLPNGQTGPDYEDTQMGLRVRDNLCRIGAKYKIQLVFHGCAIPSGERRRWPHVVGTEAIKGQEGNPSVQSDNCIAYIRNPLGPVDWSPTWFGNGGKTDAYQLATSVVFESGLLIFADLHQDYLAHPTKDFLKHVPAAWDETKFIDGYPASHTVIAHRKGNEWYVGGLTAQARDCEVALDFLEQGTTYTGTIYRDKLQGLELTIETRQVSSSDSLTLKTADRGGFVVHLARRR
jgi:alpha-glucosidase